MQPSQATWGASSKTLADYVKESAWHSSASSSASLNTTNHNATTSMPWVAAVKSPPDHHAAVTVAAAGAANSYDYQSGGAIGSWSSPETDNSRSRGWNADGSSKSDGVLDDGTAIWGNPISKKTGVDWTDKEATMNPPHAQKVCNNSEAKRIQKPEPIISSINGTEAWGAPLNRGPLNNSSSSSQHQQQPKIDNGGNTYGVKSNDSLAWGESTTSKSSSSSLQQATLEKSSPPNTSVWNNMGISSKQKSSDWLSSSSNVIGSATSSNASLRSSELDKQLEATGLFDSMSKNASCNNPNLEQRPIGVNLECSNGSGSENSIGVGVSVMNDLKQMSANYPNDLLDSPIRQPNSSSTNANQQSQALDSTAFSAAISPSRDLLKQMVHQIQLAVQAGHLNAHILNQPMSTPTLQLVYQLLQHIKTLHQLLEIQQRAGMKPDMSSPSNLDMQINRIRQNISSLQKAITHQQATLTQNETPIGDSNMKQQQQRQQQQQQATHSYATISKLSTNMKVPPSTMANMNNSSNIESFRRSSFIDTSSNSNSDPLRSAQATFDANATSDKTLSSLVQASSANIILGNSNAIDSGDFTKAQCFTSGNINQQQSGLKGLLTAQSSSSSSAWSAFSSGEFNSPQGGWPSQSRISSNASRSDQPHQFSAFDMMQEFGAGKPWPGSPILLQDDKRTSVEGSSTMMPRAANGNVSSIARPNSASNTFKHMNENDIMNNRDSSLFCDWGNGGGQNKRDFDPMSSGAPSYSTPPIGSGLSLQSNPWMFGSDASSLNRGGDKLNNGNSEKAFGDSLFLKSSNSVADQQGSSSALYDWSDITSATPQLVAESAGKQQFGNYSGSIGKGRPAPPPGLMSNIGPLMGTSTSSNGISMLDSKSGGSANEAIGSGLMQSRESSSSLWSGAWFD